MAGFAVERVDAVAEGVELGRIEAGQEAAHHLDAQLTHAVERKGAADRVLDAFAAGRTDVLLGTRLVTKGLDIAALILVGVVSADIALNLPDERASERT